MDRIVDKTYGTLRQAHWFIEIEYWILITVNDFLHAFIMVSMLEGNMKLIY